MDIPAAIRTAREWDRSQKSDCDCAECQEGKSKDYLYIFRSENVIRSEEARNSLKARIKDELEWCKQAVIKQERYEEEYPGQICPEYRPVKYNKLDIAGLENLLEVIDNVEIDKEFI